MKLRGHFILFPQFFFWKFGSYGESVSWEVGNIDSNMSTLLFIFSKWLVKRAIQHGFEPLICSSFRGYLFHLYTASLCWIWAFSEFTCLYYSQRIRRFEWKNNVKCKIYHVKDWEGNGCTFTWFISISWIQVKWRIGMQKINDNAKL